MMTARQRFFVILSLCFLLLAGVALWRIVAVDGIGIWYVPLLLVGASGALALSARRCSGEKE